MSIRKKPGIMGLGVLLIAVFSTVMVVKSFACTQGCTPGFWKNPKHFDQWHMFLPSDSVGDALDPLDLWPAEFDFLKNFSLLQALRMKFGKGWRYTKLEKMALIYIRQAVATLLNTAHPNISSYNNIYGVRTEVRSAFLTLSPEIIEAHKDMLQRFNELGSPICD